METLSIVAAIASIPSVFFILAAKISGRYKILSFLGLKLPSLIAIMALILMAFIHFGLITIN